jgi:integrase
LFAELVRELGGDPCTLQKIIGIGKPTPAVSKITISKLCAKYLDFADDYYFLTDSDSARESERIENGLRPLLRLFGRTRAVDFGPLKLKQVRDEMISLGWCRRGINQQIGRIKRMFKWATENEIIPPTVFHSVQPVAGLRFGRSKAHESLPVKPVPQELIDEVLKRVTTPIRTMINLQLLTGMRPGEVVIMRTSDIDRSGALWTYQPSRHKTAHHGHERLVFLGPKAQEILKPFLKPELPDQFLFSPVDADRERRETLRAKRGTPLSCGNRAGTNRKRSPKRKPGARYVAHSYGRAIKYACRSAFPIPKELDAEQAKAWRRRYYWHPHQLRHNAATHFRKTHGLDVAQVLLGHKTLAVTQVYAERDNELAMRIVQEDG